MERECDKEHVVVLGTQDDGTIVLASEDGSLKQVVRRKSGGGSFRLEPTDVDGLYHQVATGSNRSKAGYSRTVADNWDRIFGVKPDATAN